MDILFLIAVVVAGACNFACAEGSDSAKPEGKQRPTLGIGFGAESKTTVADKKDDSLPGPQVVHVVAGGPAHAAGVQAGDCVIRLHGKKIETAKDVLEVCKELRIGKPTKLAVKRYGEEKKEWVTRFMEVTPIPGEELTKLQDAESAQQKKVLAERRREAQARSAELHERDRAEAAQRVQELLSRPPLEITAGALGRDIINQPVLSLRVKSNRPQRIEAYEVTVQCFTKFGDPVKGPRGSHIYEGISQSEVEAEGEAIAKWQLTFHSTTGLARVRIERVKLANGTVWKPEQEDEGWIEFKTK